MKKWLGTITHSPASGNVPEWGDVTYCGRVFRVPREKAVEWLQAFKIDTLLKGVDGADPVTAGIELIELFDHDSTDVIFAWRVPYRWKAKAAGGEVA